MDAARWERVQAIFLGAVEQPESERVGFLETACCGDDVLTAEVAAMMRADSSPCSILDAGLPEVAYRTVGLRSDPVATGSVGPYRLKRVLGEGGMGVVWLAEREDAGNLVAIKFLPHAALSPARRERFAREIKTLAKLQHPYIARLYDAGTLAHGTPWFVMEYVQGSTFAEYCRAGEHSLGELITIFRKVCDAVQFAHGREIIHRDLKPSNVLVETDGTPRLLDFGIARELQNGEEPGQQTRAGLRFLSLDYAAPEWVKQGVVGFYTDVYSLGVMLYEVLSGRLPARSEAAMAQAPSGAGRQRFPTVGASAWADLDVLCLKAMHPDADARYVSVEALIRDIHHYLNGQPLEARPDTLRYRAGKFVRRNQGAVFGSVAAILLSIGLIVFFTLRLAAERDHANHESALATAMNQFLADDLLGRSDPFRSGKAQESFVDVVARSAPQIDAKFTTEPVVAARLHAILAKAFEDRSDYARARVEYEKSRDFFVRGEGPLSQGAIRERLQEAAMEATSYESGSLARSKVLLADGEKSLSRIGQPQPELAVIDLMARGVVALRSNDPVAAGAAFSTALQRARAIPGFDGDRTIAIQRNLIAAYVHQGVGAKAEPLARETIALITKIHGADSIESLWTRGYLAQAFLIQHKFAEAVEEVDRIYPQLVRSVGEDQQMTLTVLGTRAAAEGALMRWDDAVRDDLLVYALASRKHGPPSMFTIGMLSDAGLSQCRAGHQKQGESNAREAHLKAIQAFGAKAALSVGSSYALAVCLIDRNALAEASTLLRNLDVEAAAHLTGDPSVAADVELAEADIAFRRGDYAAVRRYVAEAKPTLDRPDAEAFQRRLLQKLSKAVEAH